MYGAFGSSHSRRGEPVKAWALPSILAGILLLVTEPFRVGDQIVVDAFEGDVVEVQTRATLIRTYDGRSVVIPNADLYTKPVTVNTAYPTRRNEFDIPIASGERMEETRRIICEVLVAAEGVLPDPKADCVVVKLDASSVTLRARWWSNSRSTDQILARDRVLSMIKQRLRAAGIHP